ncbi:MAG: hypothetical protein ACHP9Z_20070 [Streptosporangiales bacterium]
MTDPDTLRRVLQAPFRPAGGEQAPGPSPAALDIGMIMIQGRRLRRRRRLLAAGGSMGLVLGCAAAISGLSHLRAGAAAPAAHPAAAGHAAHRVDVSPGPATVQPSPVPSPSASGGRLVTQGRVIRTGIRGATGELLLYVAGPGRGHRPGTHFAVVAGFRNAAGHLVPVVTANETAGPDAAAGFHAVEAPLTVGTTRMAIPEFGYYAGAAVKITGTVAGRLVRAHTARWSADPGIVIFWFTPAGDPANATAAVTGLAAYAAGGRRLPTGHAVPGTG